MPTLEDVSKRAGVSTATASKVLSNTPYFTDETRQKVMQAVKELGYIPNLAARALSTGKTHIIAVVFPYVYEAIFTDPNVMHILAGIETECTSRGYNILLSTPNLSANEVDHHYLQLIQSGYLDGILAIDAYPEASALEPAQAKGIPSVAIGYGTTDHYVRHNDRAGGRAIGEHLLALGHTQIGIIDVPEVMNYGVQERLIGLRTACVEANIDFEALPIRHGDWSTASGAKCAAELLTTHPDLTALLCMNDRMAMGAIQQTREMGRDIPGDLSITGYDDIPTAAFLVPPLTTVSQRAPEQGQVAARMLFDILDGGKPDPVELPPQLMVRQSSGPATWPLNTM
ncbi:MAG: LacI family DNA-binding transcriptional regulator [Anaerolineae bacterium]|nr:LacI family DNA-binding transcriptional regulator [Anaerolineae bacterium]